MNRYRAVALLILMVCLVGAALPAGASPAPVRVLVLTQNYLPLNSMSTTARGVWDLGWFLQDRFREEPAVQVEVLRDTRIAERLAERGPDYDLFVFLDVPAPAFAAGQLERIAERVQAGASLVMVGGEASFEGTGESPSRYVGKLGGRELRSEPLGTYHGTALEPLLPVVLAETPSRPGARRELEVVLPDHPLMRGISWRSYPDIPALNLFTAKPGATVLAQAGEVPYLVLGKAGRGQVLASAGWELDPDLWQGRTLHWASYERWWRRIISYLTGRELGPLPRRPSQLVAPSQPPTLTMLSNQNIPGVPLDDVLDDLASHGINQLVIGTYTTPERAARDVPGLLRTVDYGMTLRAWVPLSGTPGQAPAVGPDGQPLGRPCYANPQSLAVTVPLARSIAEALKPLPNLKLISFDDELSSPWNDYCDDCVATFRKRYQAEPPRAPVRLTDPPEAKELWVKWMTFKVSRQSEYFGALSAAVREVLPNVDTTHSPDSGGVAAVGGYYAREFEGNTVVCIHSYPYGDSVLNTSWGTQWAKTAARRRDPGTTGPNRRLERPKPIDQWCLQAFGYNYDPAGYGRGTSWSAPPPAPFLWEQAGLVLSQGLTRFGYFIYTYPYYGWILPGTEAWDAAADINATAVQLAPLLTTLREEPSQVDVLFAFSTDALQVLGWETDQGAWKHYHHAQMAWMALQRAHIPSQLVVEEDLLEGYADRTRVLLLAGVEYLRPEVQAKVEALARTHKVFLDANCRIAVPGAERLPFAFDGWFKLLSTKQRDRKLADPLIISAGEAVAPLLEPYVRRVAKADSPLAILSVHPGADAQYLFVVSDERERSLTTRITLGPGVSRVREVLTGKTLTLKGVRGQAGFDCTLAPGGLAVYRLEP